MEPRPRPKPTPPTLARKQGTRRLPQLLELLAPTRVALLDSRALL